MMAWKLPLGLQATLPHKKNCVPAPGRVAVFPSRLALSRQGIIGQGWAYALQDDQCPVRVGLL